MKGIRVYMKVLLCTLNFNDGGVTKAFIEAERCLVENGIQCDILVEKNEGVYRDYFSEKNVKELKFRFAIIAKLLNCMRADQKKSVIEKICINFIKIIRKLFYFNILFFLANMLTEKNDNDYDIVIDFHGYGNFMTYYLSHNFPDSKKYTWVHDERIHTLKYIYKEFRRYDKVCCVSSSCKYNIESKYPFLNNVSVVHNIINVKRIKEFSNQFHVNNDKKLIVSVGRLEHQKGFDIIPEIALKLQKDKIDFLWLIIGDGSLYDELDESINKYDLNHFVHLKGFCKNSLPYIKNAYIYFQPSFHEGFPTTISEAVVLEKVIVASNIPSMYEAIQNINNELLIPRDVDLMYKLLKNLLTDTKMYQKYQDSFKEIEIDDFSNDFLKLVKGDDKL